MSAIIEQLEAHPRLDSAYVTHRDQGCTHFRIIVSGEGWPDRRMSFPIISDELLEEGGEWLADWMVEATDRAVERQQ